VLSDILKIRTEISTQGGGKKAIHSKIFPAGSGVAAYHCGCGRCGAASKRDQSADLQEVVVTGIRQSLEAAIDVKRNADSFVDAINAEDVGKLPDANLAEVSRLRVPVMVITRREATSSPQRDWRQAIYPRPRH